jgi:DNA-binding CsgD family transcriptional regulator/tetratricopeptide (TPR) repeat protein
VSAAGRDAQQADLQAAKAELARCDWAEALAVAQRLGSDARPEVEAPRLDIIADATWWLGRLDECIAAREAAYAAYESAGDNRRAGQCAVWLYVHHRMKMRPAVSGGWLRRARRALENDAECVEFGNLVLHEVESLHAAGDLDEAGQLVDMTLGLARRLASVDLEADALQAMGRVLIDAGRFAEGLGHLDEAMLYVTEGRLTAYTTGKVYCSLIGACEELGDLQRAAEWTDATLRWSAGNPLAMWPGLCRVHRATLLQLRGDFHAAEVEARRACEELDGFHLPNVAAGYVEIGEIRRRLGDLDGADAAFRHAEELCGQRSPGLALVRLAQGRVDDARAIIAQALEDQPWNRLARGKLLPAHVEIAVAAEDLVAAAAAADELDGIAAEYESPALSAAALSSRGRLQVAEGDNAAACRTLHAALKRWEALEVPYEVATVRLLLGRACRSDGDEAAATQSLTLAAAIFDGLGAALDARLTRELTAFPSVTPPPAPAGLSAREVEVLCHVASGRTNKEIAADLVLSERTVARHLSNIFVKIGVTSRTAATAFAFEHGIAELRRARRG